MRRILFVSLGFLAVCCIFVFLLIIAGVVFYPEYIESLYSGFEQFTYYPETVIFLPYLFIVSVFLVSALLECRRADFPAWVLFRKIPALKDMKKVLRYPMFFWTDLFLTLPGLILIALAGESLPDLNDMWGDWLVPGDPVAVTLENTLLCISTILVAPVVEEFLFRGLLLHRLSYKYGAKEGLILSSVIFGLMHGLDLGAVFIGFVFGWYYIQNGSLWVSIGLHMSHNTMVVIMASLTAYGVIDLAPSHVSFWVFWGVGVLCFIGSVYWLKHIDLHTLPPFLKIKPPPPKKVTQAET